MRKRTLRKASEGHFSGRGARIRGFWCNFGTNCLRAACNHGMRAGMATMSPPRRALSTQQTGGLTRGMTLRAIPTRVSMLALDSRLDRRFTAEPSQPKILRARRYRTFSRGWAFRPTMAGSGPGSGIDSSRLPVRVRSLPRRYDPPNLWTVPRIGRDCRRRLDRPRLKPAACSSASPTAPRPGRMPGPSPAECGCGYHCVR